MKRIVYSLCLILGLGSFMAAQEQELNRQITVQGSGFFTKDSSGNGVKQNATDSGGLTIGYRYSLNRWLGVEGDYDYFSNSLKYFSSGDQTRIKTSANAITGAAVIKAPTFLSLKPYVLAGGGVMIFNPRDHTGGDSQTRGTFVYGAGADYALTKHLAVRAQYRGFVYRAPDFELSTAKTDAWTHSAVPSAGLVWNF